MGRPTENMATAADKTANKGFKSMEDAAAWLERQKATAFNAGYRAGYDDGQLHAMRDAELHCDRCMYAERRTIWGLGLMGIYKKLTKRTGPAPWDCGGKDYANCPGCEYRADCDCPGAKEG